MTAPPASCDCEDSLYELIRSTSVAGWLTGLLIVALAVVIVAVARRW